MILKNHLKTKDYRGKTIDVGFRDEDELLSYIDVDRRLDREQRSKAEEILKQRQREKLLSDENIESKKEQVKENTNSIKKNCNLVSLEELIRFTTNLT